MTFHLEDEKWSLISAPLLKKQTPTAEGPE
jgi:hypothetical protein